MNEVYKAREIRLDRMVAVISAAQFPERFEREAYVVTAINHRRICTLRDSPADGKRFLLTQLLEERASVPITVIGNWRALLKKGVAAP